MCVDSERFGENVLRGSGTGAPMCVWGEGDICTNTCQCRVSCDEEPRKC